MQRGDYTSPSSYYNNQYPPPPNQQPQFPPNPPYPSDPIPPLPTPYASAPPYTTPSEYPNYPSSYPPPTFSQNPDHIPTAPSYAPNPNSQPSPFIPPPQQPPSTFPSFESHAPYQIPNQSQPYDHPVPNYTPPNPNLHYPSQYTQSGLNYETPFDQTGSGFGAANYFDENLTKYGGGGYNSNLTNNYATTNTNNNVNRSNSVGGGSSGGGGDYYGKRQEYIDYKDDGAYAYSGSSKVEPYGARGTGSKSSMWSGGGAQFDDYGRAISSPSSSSSGKIVKAVPKVEVDQDVKSGVQKFRVKLLAESGGQSNMDVLCQIGLDGIRMLDPNTSRTLRIYPLETITRCDGADSSIFMFWSKSSVDIEPRRIRLQSNKYTTNTILDIVTAATVQIKEMGARSRPSDFTKAVEQSTEKKKGFGDWMNIIKPANEEKDHWVPDEAVSKCTACGTDFGAFVRRHHCRNCGDIFCDKCTHGRIALTADENAQPVRVCDRCLAEVTQRLSNAKEAANKPAGLQTHEDLARKLQEEMERNRRATSGSKSDSSGRRMKEVACPTCTVHLQVQVPSSGSETIECGVCQHPFLVSAH